MFVRKKNIAKLFIAGCSLVFASCSQQQQVADKIITGKIWTGDSSKAWAAAMAMIGDSIVAVGELAEVEKWAGEKTEKITTDTANLIVPGFIDCHTHFVDAGNHLGNVKLREAKTPAEFIRQISDFAKTVPAGTWITGGEWDHQNWDGTLPVKEWIDSVSPNNPVWVTRLDGHMGLANTAALKAAGIDNNVKDTIGGTVIRNKGQITGLMKDNAKEYIRRAIAMPGPDQMEKSLEAAMNYVASHGVTSIHSMTGTGFSDYWDVYARAQKNNKLITRIYAATSLSDWPVLEEHIKKAGKGDKWFKVGILKGFVDGSLGSHTAAFLQPFSDNKKDSGFFVIEPDSLYRSVKAADNAGLHVTVHAIGDKSIRTLLDIFERVAKENGPKDRRFRMEHAQHIDPADLKRFAELNVIASMQPYHAIDDGRWAEKVIGHERSRYTYAFRSLLDAKAKLVFGSDWFVAPADPVLGIYAAVTRRTIDDKTPDGWIPEQKITVEQGLRAYTIDAAAASFDENIKGSLMPGKLADFVVLDKNILAIDPVQLKDVKVLKTFVGGKLVYGK